MESSRKASVKKSAYLFECKGIQRYIFGSGRLRQVIGASDLIAGVARSDGEDVLKPVFEAVGIENPAMSRRAGAAFCAHADNEALGRFRRLWRLVVGVRYPGLEFSDIEPVDADSELEAAQLAYSRLTAVRENSTAFLPPTGHPFVTMNPRTGLVAVGRPRQDKDKYLDAVGAAAHQRGEELRSEAKVDRLAADFLRKLESGGDADPPLRFPRHFEPADATARNPAFPFTGQDRRIGVVHADLSGLGQVFQSLMGDAKSSQDIFDVATAIEGAIVEAAGSASAEVLLPRAVDPSSDPGRLGHLLGNKDGKNASRHKMRIVPARPILLGGDDLTVVVRADIAITFSERFLQCVEAETEKAFGELRDRFPGLPNCLSACAGIAVVAAGYPFTVAERLAEGLCDSAKARAKSIPKSADAPFPSYLDFAVVTSTIDESLASWRRREQMIREQMIMADTPEADSPLSTTTGPRRVDAAGAEGGGDSLESLFVLAEALNAAPGRGKLLEALGLRHESKTAAETAWKRFWEVVTEDNPAAGEQLHEALEACEPGVGASPVPDMDRNPDMDRSIAVISDAMELLDIGAAPRPREDGTGAAKP